MSIAPILVSDMIADIASSKHRACHRNIFVDVEIQLPEAEMRCNDHEAT